MTHFQPDRILSARAMEGYNLVAERAQVREIGDNDHPLYCHGVGTFDFDNPLAKMTQSEAEKDVNESARVKLKKEIK